MDPSITLQQRADFYAAAFPDWPAPWVGSDGRLCGIWFLGNNYRGASMYGAYPPNYLARLFALFPDAGRTLHLFSGTLERPDPPPPGWTSMDIRITPDVRPMVRGDAEHLPFAPGAFDFVVADPPYSKPDAKKYGTRMVNRAAVFRALARIVAPGGVVAWLDCSHPQYRKAEWDLFGFMASVRSTNHRYRGTPLFRRR